MNTDPTIWRYRTRVDRVVDGDTLDLTIDLGFGVILTTDESRVRLKGVDTAEIYGKAKDSEEYQRGMTHKSYVEEWVTTGREAVDTDWPFRVETYKSDERGKYGRLLGELGRVSDGHVLNQDLRTAFEAEVTP